MPTYQTQLVFVAPGQAGQAANVRCSIYDNARNTLISGSNAPGGTAFAESGNVPGSFYAPFSVDITKLPITADFWVAGSGAAGSTVIGNDFAAVQAQGFTAALATLLGKLLFDGSGYVKSRPQTLADVSGTGAGQISLNNGLVAITSNVKKDTALPNFQFLMVSSVDYVTPVTGLALGAITAQRSLDGGAFAACANAVQAELGYGSYNINLAAGDLNANVVALRFTAAGCAPTVLTVITQP